MTTKHTPGPWTAKPFLTPDCDDDPLGVYAISVGDSLQSRYENCMDLEPGSDDEQSALDAIHAENEANARLISLTPEMFDYLTRVARSACLQQRVSGECICFSCEAGRLIALATESGVACD